MRVVKINRVIIVFSLNSRFDFRLRHIDFPFDILRRKNYLAVIFCIEIVNRTVKFVRNSLFYILIRRLSSAVENAVKHTSDRTLSRTVFARNNGYSVDNNVRFVNLRNIFEFYPHLIHPSSLRNLVIFSMKLSLTGSSYLPFMLISISFLCELNGTSETSLYIISY